MDIRVLQYFLTVAKVENITKAAELLKTMIKAQGGDERVVDDTSLLPSAKYMTEIKADKTIKGKIFRNEEGNYYFEVGVDKEGNLLPVDFSAIQPGMSIKILSK